MMIDFLKLKTSKPFHDWVLRTFDRLFPNAGAMTPKGCAIMLLSTFLLIFVLFYIYFSHPRKIHKFERKQIMGKKICIVAPYWLAKEIIMFVGNKLRRKKR